MASRRSLPATDPMHRPLVRDADGHPIAPATVIEAYRRGIFPMASGATGPLRWYRPARRAVITPGSWRLPASVRRELRRRPYRVAFDRDFPAIIRACASRPDTWISHDIVTLYTALFELGYCHAVAAYDADTGELAGGLYGLAIGGCFSGESMFHFQPGASKACVVALNDHLWRRGFTVHDCQQLTPHMARFGAYEVSHRDYLAMLQSAAAIDPAWSVDVTDGGSDARLSVP